MFVSSIKIISYERIDKSDSIDFNRSEKSRECMICHYFYIVMVLNISLVFVIHAMTLVCVFKIYVTFLL